MTRLKSSILWTLSKEKCQELINNFDTFSAILSSLKLCPAGGNLKTLRKVFTSYKLDYSKFSLGLGHNKDKKIKSTSIVSNTELFTANSIYSRKMVKDRILKNKLIPYKCQCCGQEPIWNGKKLVLVLDHINGIANDHRLENLRFLCPNCNAQQDTFCGKHTKKILSNEEKQILKEINQEDIDNKIIRIKKYPIDYSKYGWVVELAKLEKCSHTSIRRFMRKYMPDFYYNCYQRNNQYN